MRLFIGNPRTGKFQKMITPYTIDPDPYNGLILYVYDSFGHCYVLTFSDRNSLVNTMSDLRSQGISTAMCSISEYIPDDPIFDSPDRELEFDIEEEMELDYEL